MYCLCFSFLWPQYLSIPTFSKVICYLILHKNADEMLSIRIKDAIFWIPHTYTAFHNIAYVTFWMPVIHVYRQDFSVPIIFETRIFCAPSTYFIQLLFVWNCNVLGTSHNLQPYMGSNFTVKHLGMCNIFDCNILNHICNSQGQVVQSIVSLTTSLKLQIIKYMPT